MPSKPAAALLAAAIFALATACEPAPGPEQLARRAAVVRGPTEPVRGLKAAFLGDQSIRWQSKQVLKLIVSEGADLVVHQGDLDYRDDPDYWDAMITEHLGADFPYFVSLGNHDKPAWPGYEAKLEARLQLVERNEGRVVCGGLLGVQAACNFRGLFFITSGVGTKGKNHEQFFRDQLSISRGVWEICSWHKTMPEFQVGRKLWGWDNANWDAYEICRENGALVMSGHDHAYAASCLMSDFRNQTIASCDPPFEIAEGQTIVVVSGLGGAKISPVRAWLKRNDWWAATYDEKHGALFCTFNPNGDPRQADCYFKDIEGRIVQQFALIRGGTP